MPAPTRRSRLWLRPGSAGRLKKRSFVSPDPRARKHPGFSGYFAVEGQSFFLSQRLPLMQVQFTSPNGELITRLCASI